MSSLTILTLSALAPPALGAVWFTAPVKVPDGAAPALSPAFVSYSIELSWLPDYAGNTSDPNSFFDNLLQQFADFSGDVRPTIRVGGSSQDRVAYNASQATARIIEGNGDVPSSLTIGPTFFESLTTFANTRFIYGLNMKSSVSDSDAYDNMLDTVAAVCSSFSSDNLLAWSYGNEPNLYGFDDWEPADYTTAWLEAERDIKSVLEDECPDLVSDDLFGFLTPSVSNLHSGHVNIPDTLEDGINDDGVVFFLGAHNYMGDSDDDISRQATLMNHTTVVDVIDNHVSLMEDLIDYDLPYGISETNSLYGGGKDGVSNTFGAALWALDFAMQAAANNISRVNFHMGTDYRYSAWQPIETDNVTIGTKAPYYGNLAAAAILGDLTNNEVQVVDLDADSSTEAAYGLYHSGSLAKIVALSLYEYNFTASGNATDGNLNHHDRGGHNYSINLDDSFNDKTATIRRLMAPGADSITGVTWDAYTFNYEVANGVASRLSNVTYGEEVTVADGKITVNVPFSSALVLEF